MTTLAASKPAGMLHVDSRAEMSNLQTENERLHEENRQLHEENARLRRRVDELYDRMLESR